MAETGKLATVFGGSGFVGRQIVWSLARRDYRVRAAVRRPDLAGYLQPMGVVGQVFGVQANLRFADSVMRAVEGAETVVNSVGILAPTGAQTFQDVHVEGARRIAKAAREAGVQRLVHISAIGANKNSNSKYAVSKAEGEAASDQAAGMRTRLEAEQATRQWLNRIVDRPERFLKARIELEARRRKESGTAPETGADAW